MANFSFADFPAVPVLTVPLSEVFTTPADIAKANTALNAIRERIRTNISYLQPLIEAIEALPAGTRIPTGYTLESFLNIDKLPGDVIFKTPDDVFICLQDEGKEIDLEERMSLMFMDYAMQQSDVVAVRDFVAGELIRGGGFGFYAAFENKGFATIQANEDELYADNIDIMAWVANVADFEAMRIKNFRDPKEFLFSLSAVSRTNEFRIMFLDMMIDELNGVMPPEVEPS